MTTQQVTHPQAGGMVATAESYFNRQEAARYLGVGISTLAKLAMDCQGPILVRIGRSVRYRRTDLDRWMAQRLSA